MSGKTQCCPCGPVCGVLSLTVSLETVGCLAEFGDLIAAFAAERDRLNWEWWDRIEEQHPDDPRALLEALLSEIARRIGGPAYRGCPFLNLATEFPDDNHPGWVAARANKEEMRSRNDCRQAGRWRSQPRRVSDSADHQRRVRHRPGGETG